MKTSELAYAAAEYLSEHGHTKGQFENRQTGEVCMMGAARRVLCPEGGFVEYRHPERSTWYKLFNTNLSETGYLAIPAFNDRPETTKEDAVLKLKEIGRMYEEEGD